MDPSRWQRIKEVVAEALERPPGLRRRFIEEQCPTDPDLRAEVDSLLRVSESEAALFDEPGIAVFPQPETTLVQGTRIDQYIIERLVGRGGMSTVYRALDTRNDRQVALKILRPHAARLSTNEHSILARLNHPNIATLYDSGTTHQGDRYLAIEYVEGERIDEYCANRRLVLRERLRLLQKVCATIAYAHSHLVVHRDIKPSNILVTPDGTPTILDFGIAKVLPQTPDDATVTRPLERPLSLAFSSPEQLSGDATGIATDVYSLGILLTLLLTARLPYDVEHKHDLPWAIRHQRPTPPSELVAEKDTAGAPPRKRRTERSLARELRRGLDAIALKALEKAPDDRYQSVNELTLDLDRYLSHEPVRARSSTTLQRTGLFLRRHAIGVLVCVGVLLGLLGFVVQREVSHRNLAEEQQNTERVVAFLAGLFNLASPDKAQGAELTPEYLLGGGEKEIYSKFSDKPHLQARLFMELGDIARRLGRYDDARRLTSEALALQREAGDAEEKALAGTFYVLGAIDHDEGRYDEAAVHFAEALGHLEGAPTAGFPEMTQILNSLGSTSFYAGRMADAKHYFTEAIEAARKTGDDEEAGRAAMNTAGIDIAMGDYEAAAEGLEKAVPFLREALGERHPHVLVSVNNLASAYWGMGQLEKAKSMLEESLKIQQEVVGTNHLDYAHALRSLGSLNQTLGEYDQAERQLLEALRIVRDELGIEKHAFLPEIHHSLGVTYLYMGRLEESEEHYSIARDMWKNDKGDEHLDVARALHGLADVFAERRNFEVAESLYEQAIRIREANLPPDHQLLKQVRGGYADMLRLAGRDAEADSLLERTRVVEANSSGE